MATLRTGGERLLRVSEDECVLRRITDRFAHVILFHSCILLHIWLLPAFSSFRGPELCKFGWNESSQLYTLEKMQCLFVGHLRGDGIDWWLFFFQVVGVTCRHLFFCHFQAERRSTASSYLTLITCGKINKIFLGAVAWLILRCRHGAASGTQTFSCCGGLSGSPCAQPCLQNTTSPPRTLRVIFVSSFVC